MPAVQRSVVIDAPIDAVFSAATDPNRGPEWNPNILQVEPVPLPVHPGTEWQQTAMAMGRQLRMVCRVTEFDPPRLGRLSITGDQQGGALTRCDDLGGKTQLTQTLEFEMPGGILGRMVGGMVDSMLGRELEQSLNRIKITLEIEQGGRNEPGSAG